MELKVNDYVRTKQGDIGKAIIITEYNTNIDYKKVVSTKDIIKSNPNIINLIQKKDIVVDYNNKIYQVQDIFMDYVITNTRNCYGEFVTLADYQIKGIVTKEMFEQMEYKVGE